MSTANVIPFPSNSRRARVIVMTPRSSSQAVAPTKNAGQLIVLPLRRREPKPPSALRELRRQVRLVQRWLRAQ